MKGGQNVRCNVSCVDAAETEKLKHHGVVFAWGGGRRGMTLIVVYFR